MMLVIVFLVLLLSLLGSTLRQAGSVLRVESARSRQILRDEGSLQAAARGVGMLESSGPPISDPYVVTIAVLTSAGPASYQITFASDPSGPNQWTVQVVPAPN